MRNVKSMAKFTPPIQDTPSTLKDKAHMLNLYKDMLLIRRFEERSAQLYGMGLIGGFCHLYIGQEAIVVGLQSVMQEGDSVITSYRDHGHMLACGMDPKRVMAELTGRRDGYSKGKGGSMHMFSIEKRFYGGHGIVGAQVPIGTGLAFSYKYNNEKNVCVTYMGDGAVNQGQVYEAFNMAALWKLPVLYIIENNQYGMGTSVKRAAAGATLCERGQPYGIPGVRVDGMNIMEVQEKGKKALDYIRAGKGPYILEMMTYRYRGHSMSDPAKYRSKEEVSVWKDERDPIEHLKNYILTEQIANQDDFTLIEKDLKVLMQEVVDFAQNSPEPDVDELYTDILTHDHASHNE